MAAINIGAPGGENTHALAREPLDRRLDRFLDRAPVVLALPADEARTVVFQRQLVACGHEASSSVPGAIS